MANTLKSIIGYPENAIAWAMQSLPSDELCAFKTTLKKIEQRLGEKPEKKLKTKQLPSDKEVFLKHIIPTIMQCLDDLASLQDAGKAVDISLHLNFKANLQVLTLEELTLEHVKIDDVESKVRKVNNFVKFYKGMIYHVAHEKCGEAKFKQWLQQEKITVTSSTVYRHH